MNLLEDKLAIITGGSRGIGKSIALKLANEKCNISIIGRTKKEVDSSINEIKNLGVNAIGFVGDQSDESFVKDTINSISSEFLSIDILINNAAVGMRYIEDSNDRFIHNMNSADWKTILDINLNGVFYFTRETLKVMRNQMHGHIVMISSGLGRRAYQQYGPYSASKFAMEAMMQIVSLENAEQNISCNSVAPGGLTNSSEKFLGKMEQSKLDEILPANICDDLVLHLVNGTNNDLTGQALTASQWNEENNISVQDLRSRLH